MLWFATLAALAVDAPAQDVAPQRQARAVVRILKAARIEFGEAATAREQQAIVRETSIKDADGTAKPALLVEFS